MRNTIPLNLIIFTSTAGHYDFDTYEDTVNHIGSKMDINLFNNKYVHIKVRPKESYKLQKMNEFFVKNNFKVIVTDGDWHRGMSHQNEYLKDIFKVFNTDDIHKSQYSFWVEDDSPLFVKTSNLYTHITEAIKLLENSKDILNVRFSREGVLDKNITQENYVKSEFFDFQPNIGRTRDLFLAAKIIRDNWEAFSRIQCEMAFRLASNMLSYAENRFVCINPNYITSFHIGIPDYKQIISSPEYIK